jgi:hypothetical protein
MGIVAVLGRAALAIAVLAGLAACTKTPAHVPGPTPVLDTPAPPDRLIVPSPLPAPIEPAAAASPPPPAPQQPPRQTAANNRPPDRTSSPTPPPTTPAQAETSPPPVLQTTSNVAELEQEARRLIGNAERDLGRVVRAGLSNEGKRDFDSAKGFIGQAHRSLKIKNFNLAKVQAETAATLASALVKR